jgi:Kef-type K+ transport system membrane component KefB
VHATVNATLATMALILVVAVVSPVVSDVLGGLRVSSPAIEIVGGVLIGPGVFDVAHLSSGVLAVSTIGLAFLMFLAGFEIEFAAIRGRPLRLAAVGWAVSAALGVLFGVAAQLSGGAISWTVTALALATTALALLMPMWRDASILDTGFGILGVASGTLGEFAPIVAMSLILTDTSAARTTVVLVAFSAIAVGAAVLASRSTPVRFLASLQRHTHSSGQLPVRVTALILVSLLLLASAFGVDVLLGAFAAGIVVRLGSTGVDVEVLSQKFDAIGYGLLVPVFFVVSGMRLDVTALYRHPVELIRVPLFLVGFVVVRGVPVWLLYRKALPRGQRLPFALFSATTLPLVVVIIELGLQAGLVEPATAAALEAAAVLSVLLFPSAGFRLLDRLPGGVPGGLHPPTGEA